MRAALKHFVLSVIVLGVFAGCGGTVPVEYTMANFDKAFIPAYELTIDRDTSGKSVMAVKQLKFQWTVFKSRNEGLAADGGGADGIEGKIMEADSLIIAGQYRKVHKLLKEVRVLMYEARQDSGIDYFPDRLYEFELVLDRIVRRPGDAAYILPLMPKAMEAWGKVEKKRISRENFRFNKDAYKRVKKLIKDEGELLRALHRAAASGEGGKTKKLASKVRKKYRKIFRMFGNFEGASISG